MGLFSSKKTVVVSSVVYNLAGDVNERPDYLKTTVIGAALNRTRDTIGGEVIKSYLRGPGINLRGFGRWARNQGFSSLVGQVASNLTLTGDLDQGSLASMIPHGVDETVVLQTAQIGLADYTYWVDRYMVANHPDKLGTAYEADFDEGTNTITITLVGGAVESFTPADYDPKGMYLYASYLLASGSETGALVPGSTITLVIGAPFPSTASWDENSFVSTPGSFTLTTTTTIHSTFSDGRPDEDSTSSSTSSASYTESHGEWERTVYDGWDPSLRRLKQTREVMVQDVVASVETTTTVTTSTEVIAGGVTKTTTTTVVTESLKLTRTYKIDTQDITQASWSPMNVLIYQKGTGNSDYDSLFTTTTSGGSFLPYVPVRINNQFVSDSFLPDIYAKARRAMKKSTGGKFDTIIAQVGENPSLGDIDYGYVTFGVALNVRDDSSKRYIYELFEEVMLGRSLSSSAYLAWRDAWLDKDTQQAEWQAWINAQSDPGDPLYGTPQPPQVVYPPMPEDSIRISSDGRPGINYDMTIYWSGITETTGSGLKRAGAKPGELWFEDAGVEDFNQSAWVTDDTGAVNLYSYPAYSVNKIRLNWQVDADTWRSLEIYGLRHRNMIYGGKYVEITAQEALADAEESGFIIPIHEEVFKRMPLLDSTQVSVSCSFLVFNCYEVRKSRWYESTWFKILLIVAVIAVAAFTGYFDPTTIGLLGSNLSVGTAIGFTGTAAVVAGAVANALAAIIITQLITMGSTAIFGEQVGQMIGAIVALATITIGTSILNGGSFAAGFTDLFSPENLMKMSASVGNGYMEGMRAETQDVMRETEALLTSYNEQSREISARYEEMFGLGRGVLNPLAFTENGSAGAEPPSTFFARTLMTGMDIADLSLSSVSQFSDLTLTTELPV